MTGAGSSQTGVALLTTLLAVALLTVAIVEFAYSSQVDYHLAHNALKALQATYLARSGVNLSLLVLKRDRQSTSSIDALSEDWARPLPPLPVGDGMVRVQVRDAQGKINLNTLRNTSGTINRTWRKVMERVCMLRGVDPLVLEPLLDWLDADDFPEPRGAEHDHYARLRPPYKPPNGFLLTFGELGRIEGFAAQVRAQLADLTVVLPSNNTQVNVNTAPAEVLTVLFPDVTPRAIEQFLASRGEAPVHGVNDLRDRLGIDPQVMAEVSRLVTVRSEFFAVTALATVEPVTQMLSVIVQRRGAMVVPLTWQTVTPVAEMG